MRSPPAVIAMAAPRYADGSFGDAAIRIYAAPLSSDRRRPAAGGAVVVASSTQQIDAHAGAAAPR